MMKKLFKIAFILTGGILLVFSVILGLFYSQVAKESAQRINKGVIDSIIFSESPAYYDDGKSVIGVFFDKTHRKYIRYKEIPASFVKAIVATEDGDFFDHPGFDIRSIIRAFIANVRAGRVVQGGSTITQQTAKNIFKREKRSYLAKLRELVQAIILERKYTKEEILEMYTNQFFVTGFGRGLRIASEYFFNKEAETLDLVESAFIAGSVKGPYRYDPFTKKTEVEKNKALRLAEARKNYVLSRMLSLDYITQEQYEEARVRAIPFKEGRVTYPLNVIMDYIREQLLSEYFVNILKEQGIENIATSGIKIYTSIDREVQEGTLKVVRRHLPLLDVQIAGYNPGKGKERYEKAPTDLMRKTETGLPFLCRITDIRTDRHNPALVLSWGHGGGIIDYEGMKPVGDAWLKGRLGQWAEFDRRQVPDLLKMFRTGDLVPVQQLKNQKQPEKTRLILSQVPELEGGMVVLHRGMVKAMVGGFFNRFFNRVVDAKRQLGSIFKPVVYAAALQLGWNSLDPLPNVRDVYRYQGTTYLPKPDHEPGSTAVSLTWAGVKSENLATVWLLYHLTDRLNMGQFKRVVGLLGLGRRAEESYHDYMARIRDRYGVVVNREALMEAAFETAKEEVVTDIIFGGYEEAVETLKRLHFDTGDLMSEMEDSRTVEIKRFSFRRLQSLHYRMQEHLRTIEIFLPQYREGGGTGIRDSIGEAVKHFYLHKQANLQTRWVYTEAPSFIDVSNPQPLDLDLMGDRLPPAREIWIDNLLPSAVIELLQTHMRKIYMKLAGQRRYSLEVLSKVRDFRTLVNLTYVMELSKEMGISTRLAPVLSFPLGSNAISIIEAALAYQTIMTGKIYPLAEDTTPRMVPIIRKIEDREGEILWVYHEKPTRILSDKKSALLSEILRLVMEKGTGRRGKDATRLSVEIEEEPVDIKIQNYGKTGTADQFINSSFVGFIPGPDVDSEGLDLKNGYVIASYVGYDDNRPMKGRHISIYGASGALPLWIDTSNVIVNSVGYLDGLQPADLIFKAGKSSDQRISGLRPKTISNKTGLPLKRGDMRISESTIVSAYFHEGKNGIALNRLFEPIRGEVHDQARED
jgi:membrane peptidoglycan carboxypeptidase